MQRNIDLILIVPKVINVFIKDYVFNPFNGDYSFNSKMVNEYRKVTPCIDFSLKDQDSFRIYDKYSCNYFKVFVEINNKRILEIIIHKNKSTVPESGVFYLSITDVFTFVASRILYFIGDYLINAKH